MNDYNNPLVTHRRFLQDFAIAFMDYCKQNSISVRAVCRKVNAAGRCRVDAVRLYEWRKYLDTRPVYVFTLNALCEAVGLNLVDFMRSCVPDFVDPCDPSIVRKRTKKKDAVSSGASPLGEDAGESVVS